MQHCCLLVCTICMPPYCIYLKYLKIYPTNIYKYLFSEDGLRVSVPHLDSVFECEQHVQPLLLVEVVQVDAGVKVSQLLGPDCVLGVHLGHLTIKRTPPLRGGTLRRGGFKHNIVFVHMALLSV